jgi:uncharacterized protein (TIGR01619 family)
MTEEAWDFHFAQVDDAAASIFVDLSLEHAPKPPGADTLYWIDMEMLDPDAHGMGTEAEAAVLNPLSDQIETALSDVGCRMVGRLRNNSNWQLTFYGPGDREALVQAAVSSVHMPGGRRREIGAKPDPEWSYYAEFLLPSAERRRWTADAELVDALMSRGDQLATPRQVDHWLYFDDSTNAALFSAAAAKHGFQPSPDRPQANDHISTVAVGVSRVDAVELERIHEVVMQLSDLAERHGGRYDGWGCELTTTPPPKRGWFARHRG